MPTTLEPVRSRAIPHLDPQTFVGKSYGDAKQIIEGAGYTCKTSASRLKTHWRYMKDYDPLTITLYVEDNCVLAAWKG